MDPKADRTKAKSMRRLTGRVSRRGALFAGAAAAVSPALFARAASAQAVASAPEPATPARPWAGAKARGYPPGEPGKDYKPVFAPDNRTARFHVRDGVKVFHLVAEPVAHKVTEGLTINTWGYNGSVPGPVIEAVEGDRVRIYVTNKLPAETTVHWHGLLLPCGMDGSAGLTQPAIMPGETCRYEFVFPEHGTFMYHPHFDGMTQEGLGMIGMIVVHPRGSDVPPPDRDFSLMLHEWFIEGGATRPDPQEMTEFNVLSINGRAFPGSHPLVAQLGDRVRVRIGNLSPMNHHPMHLHGYDFHVVETDGGQVPESARHPETTVLVHVGSVRVIEFLADNPGDWLMHCHMTHHTMNQMGHGFPNMLDVDMENLERKIRRLLPDYMTMGTRGMRPMREMSMPRPADSIPMLGFEGQFGRTMLGGMVTVVKVRENWPGYDDPGPYDFPEGTVARPATKEELEADGIDTA